MNMNRSPTAGQLGAKNDDDGAHTLWVDDTGEVYLDVVDDNGAGRGNARLRYAPFDSGVGAVGEDAAGDPELIWELLSSLVGQWTAAQHAPPGTRMVDLDDPESGPDWTLTEVATVDDELLTRLGRAAH